MVQDDPTIFLTNMKLIYQHGVSHSKTKSKINLLFAIHNSHYVAEQIIRDQARDITFKDALHKIGFLEIAKRVHRKQNIQYYNELLDLNTIRNNAEHLNIIPDVDAVRFYVRIVGGFLKWSYKNYYGIDYETLALENMIRDFGIRKVILEAKAFIEKNDLENASLKMYEGLAAFKFLTFGFLSDYRLEGISFKGVSLTAILADLAFKIMLAEDEPALKKIMLIKTGFRTTNKGVRVESIYPKPIFKDKEGAREHYDEILNIILTYQDRVPPTVWRTK